MKKVFTLLLCAAMTMSVWAEETRTPVSACVFTGPVLTYGMTFNESQFFQSYTPADGAPYYISYSMGRLTKKNGSIFERVNDGTAITEGTYRISCQLRIDGTNGGQYYLNNDGTLTCTVNGDAWTVGNLVIVDPSFSFCDATSPEFVVTKTVVPFHFDGSDAVNYEKVYKGRTIPEKDLTSYTVGGTETYTYTKVTNTIPWLQVSSAGIVSGTPDAITETLQEDSIKVSDGVNDTTFALKVRKVYPNPAERTVVNSAAFTGWLNPALGDMLNEAYRTTFYNRIQPQELYYHIGSGSSNVKFAKKVDGNWVVMNNDETFTLGEYKYYGQIRVDDNYGHYYRIQDDGTFTATMNGNPIGIETNYVDDEISYIYFSYYFYLAHKVTIDQPEHATISVKEDVKLDSIGENKTLHFTVSVDPGYQFVSWGNGSTEATGEYAVTSDTTITANIKKILVAGDLFRSNTKEGVSVLYKVLTNAAGDKTVQIGNCIDPNSNPQAIDILTAGELTIPDSAVYYDEKFEVVQIDQRALYLCNSLTAIHLPNTIKVLKSQAVAECTSVTDINIPEGLEYTGVNNFNYMDIASITIPGSLKYLGYGFLTANNKLTTINGWNPSQFERVGGSGSSALAPFFKDKANIDTVGGFIYAGDILLRGVYPYSEETMAIKEGTRVVCGESGNNTKSTCKHVEFPASVEAIGGGVLFAYPVLETCTINAVTPPLVYCGYEVDLEKDAAYLRVSYSSCWSGNTGSTPTDVKYYVPKAALATYQANDKWNMLDLRPIGGWTVTFKDGHTGAEIAVKNADTNGSVEAPDAPEHTGYKFNGWDSDAYQNVTGDLTITATYVSDPTGLESIQTSEVRNQKLLRDGHLLILRGDKVYTTTGQEVK